MGLSKSVTRSDRQLALVKYSHFTVSQYLNGKGKNLDTAMDLLSLFRGRIEERGKEIQNAQESQDMN
jgi:hypothetical protein